MDQNHSFNQPGTARPTYNAGASYQSNSQIQQQQNSAPGNAPVNVNQAAVNPTSSPTTNDKAEWVRFNTICNKVLVDKVRAIAERSHSSIRDVVELMFRRGINAYEQKNGIITIEAKKSLEELF